MGEKYTTARISIGGQHFEILVNPDAAFDYRSGKPVDISKILMVSSIFTDAGQGMKASDEILLKAFKTQDVFAIAELILKRGELQLTTEQRRRLTEEKRKQIINFISRNCIDPRTNLPHPPLRVEQAMAQVRVVIDPFRASEEQAKAIIDSLRGILPIKFEQLRIAVKVQPEHAGRAIGAAKDFGSIEKQEWGSDGSWIAIISMPAGLHGTFLDKLNDITHGSVQTKMLK